MKISYFSYENLYDTYLSLKKKRLTTGIDRITKNHYEKIAEQDLKQVSKKINNGTYRPTPYKEVLLIKNKNSKPRQLSLPTIRDKIILDVLKDTLKSKCDTEKIKLYELVDLIHLELMKGEYDSYIKLDIRGFYSNINHNTLFSKLRTHIRSQKVLNLINLYLKNITIPDAQPTYLRDKENPIGVPQGISISNSLGEIYLKTFDNYINKFSNCKYFRYVDDILIFCNYNDIEKIKNKIENKLFQPPYELEISKEKCETGHLVPFDFLGYHFFCNGKIGIAQKNIHKLELSLEKLFSDFNISHDKRIKNNIELLKWKIDFRITGCFKNGRRYGWVIFFCQNEIINTFYHLDWLITQLAERYNVSNRILQQRKYIGKHFVKTYHEFINRQDNSEYIPNIDKFTKQMKRDVLINVCKRKESFINSLNDFNLDRIFDRFIYSSISEIERDLYQIYT
jgi:retron-type reverse transcriptase